MGKSKTRILRKGKNDQIATMTREGAIAEVVRQLNSNTAAGAKKIITMFGLSAEELLEAGVSYEAVISIKNIFTG